jgi:NTP pyrophosphatase (non-canonical NTP hydrolase)
MEKVFCNNFYSSFNKCMGKNKILIKDNVFSNIIYDNKITLLHITSNYSNVISSKFLLPSIGCMFGGVYTTPLYFDKNKDVYRLHNLGVRYITETKEIAKINSKNENETKSLLIEIETENIGLCGVNYLKSGEVNYDTYCELINILPLDLTDNTKNNILKFYENITSFIEYLVNNKNISPDFALLNELNILIPHCPILSYIYFEAFSIAIMLNEKSTENNLYMNLGELYNGNYRKILFTLYPELFKQFNLSLFNPTLNDLKKHILEDVCNFDDFCHDILLILQELLLDTLCNFSDTKKENIFKFNDEKIFNIIVPAIGHHIRLLKSNNVNFFDFKTKFHKSNTNKFWKILKEKNNIIYYNSVIPKGEVAINPQINNKITIYDGIIDCDKDSNLYYAKKNKTLNLTIKPQLLDNKFIVMNSHKIQNDGTNFIPNPNSVMNGFQDIKNSMDKAQFVKKISTDIGFDTNNTLEKRFLKIKEEFDELKNEIDLYLNDNSIDAINIKKEMGDLLFAIGGLANMMNFSMTECLDLTIDKFVFRTCYVEKKLKEIGQDFSNGDINKMCEWWNEAKKIK